MTHLIYSAIAETSLFAEASFWQKIIEVLTTPSLQLFLLLGSLVLAISLLLLTMTRLGHARPITKCIVLSIIAHILLLGYAYGTKLIFQAPAVTKKENPIKVNLIDFERPIEPTVSPEDELVDEFAPNISPPEPAELARQESVSPFELDRVFETDLPVAELKQTPKPLDIAQIEAEQPKFNIDQPKLSFDSPESPSIGNNVAANDINFERLGEGADDIGEHQPEIRRDELRISKQVEEVEIDKTVIDQNAFPSNKDRAQQFQSEFVTPEAKHGIADEFAAATRAQTEQENAIEYQRPNNAGQRRLGDGLAMPRAFEKRAIKNRFANAIASGGTKESEAAVEASLRYLASVQKLDGHWSPGETEAGREDKVFGHDRGGSGANADNGITGLAALAFLGAGHSHLEGEHRVTVQRALEFLIHNQATNGDLSGNAKLFARMYCHSMALLALSEALAVTGDQRLKQAVTRGVAYTIEAQNNLDGGWRYQPGDSGDMSQFGWKVMALHSAKLGGVYIEPEIEAKMVSFLESCKTGADGGLASYRPSEGPNTTMTAESLVCRYFMDRPISTRELQETHRRILGELPEAANTNLYYWYYATIGMHQTGGEAWEQWNSELQRVLLSQQVSSGAVAGSWDPNGLWAGYGGRIYSTALATLCLEVYYRYQPMGQTAGQATANLSGSENGVSR